MTFGSARTSSGVPWAIFFPKSRTATVPVVDELTRAIPNVEKFVRELREDAKEAGRVARTYDRAGNLKATYSFLNWRLRNLVRGPKKKQ